MSEQGLRIYISHPSSRHPALKDLASDELNLKDATTTSIVPTESDMAAIRQEKERRELHSLRMNGVYCVTADSLPYVNDENIQQQQNNSTHTEDTRGKRLETLEKQNTTCKQSNNESVERFKPICKQNIDQADDTYANEHVNGSEDIDGVEIQKSLSDYSSVNDVRNTNETDLFEPQPTSPVQNQISKVATQRKSSYGNINASIVAQREKIGDIRNNRKRLSSSRKKKKKVHRGNYFNELRQKCCNGSDEEIVEKKIPEHMIGQKQTRDEKSENELSASSDGFLDTEDEQNDELIEFETQTELPVARKKKAGKNNTLQASSEAIGNSIAKAVTDGADASQWINRSSKRRSKLKRLTKRVSLETSLSNNVASANNQNKSFGGRRTVGFGAAPKAINKRKTQLSLLQMLKK